MYEKLIVLFAAFIISFFCTFYLVPLCKLVAIKFRFLDVPDGKIKMQKKPVPFLGGVAVYVGFLTAFIITSPVESRIALLIGGATLLLFVGLADDFLVMRPHQKLLGQIFVALCFLKTGFYLKEQFFSHFWSIPLSFLWILTIINAFNLIDVMDGLATVLAISSATTFLFLALFFNLPDVTFLLPPFIGSLLAFLTYNYPAASIYLGDAGALFIGGFLSTFPFLFNWGAYHPCGYLAIPLIFALPLVEVCSLIVIRMYKKIPFYQGSPDHFCLYLLKNGWSKPQILLYVIVVSTLLNVIAVLYMTGQINFYQLFIYMVVFFMGWIISLVPKKEKSRLICTKEGT